MEKDFLFKLFDNSSSIAEICFSLYGKKNGGMHNRVLKLFKETGYDWEKHLKDMENAKKVYCINCGKEITGKYRNGRKFCSSSCAAQYNNRLRELHSEETKSKISESLKKYFLEHKKTNEELWKNYKKTYNVDISLEDYVNKIRNKIKPIKKEKEYLKCIVCGKEIHGKNTLFCSKECKEKHDKKLYEDYIERWKNGEEPGYTPSFKIHKYVKRYLEETNHNSCQRCGWHEINEYTGNVPLQIHHIDGDCTNNSPDNIQLLCPNCHALTENFGSRNKNSKRVFRKQKMFKQEIIK